MAAHAYYDQMMPLAKAKQTLTGIGAKLNGNRSTTEAYVYSLRGGGEAMVEKAGSGDVRVRMYKGKCPC
jgi:hypothetical protein